MASTELSISHLDRVIAQNGGYPPPELPGAFSATTARRQDMQLLSMVSTPQVALQVDYMAPGARYQHFLRVRRPPSRYQREVPTLLNGNNCHAIEDLGSLLPQQVDKVAPGASVEHLLRHHSPAPRYATVEHTPGGITGGQGGTGSGESMPFP